MNIKDKSLLNRIELKGKCIGCGNCCRLNWKFGYIVDGEVVEKENNRKKPEDYTECNSFDSENNKCLIHEDKKPDVCKYWPFFKEDLEDVNCPGFTWEGE